jgi:hypothetical protein
VNESPHHYSNDNGIRKVNFTTSKNLVVKSTFPHRNIRKYTWKSPDGQTQNRINNILIDKRWHSSILDIGYYILRELTDTDHYLVVAQIRK